MPVSEAAFQRLALQEPNARWELARGALRQKPDTTAEHNYVMTRLFRFLIQQADDRELDVRCNAGHVRRSAENYFIPDVFVVPSSLVRPLRHRDDVLESYDVPLPLVVEVWSPSTGQYDVETKLMEYQRRGDLEIWSIHPYDRTLTSWVREPDGTYRETLYRSSIVRPSALSGVVIDLGTLFD